MCVEETSIHRDGYPVYRRRGGASYTIKGHSVSNAHVVPYNRYLLKRYNCHINVEVCTSIRSVKYIFKYIYKGFDCAEVQITDNNEIDQYVNSRYVSAPEAMWRLMEYKMHDRSHKVIRLPVHLQREQMIVFEEGHEEEAITLSDVQCTQLLAWFKLNEVDVEARRYLYSEIPFHYVFTKGVWTRRQRTNHKVLTRLYSVSPSEKERFFLRLLLLHIKGATSFEDLRSFRGVVFDTFERAAIARGLLQNDQEWDRVLEEAASTQSPSSIRRLFAYICAFNVPKRPYVLFDKYYQDMVDDFREDPESKDRLLSILKDILNSHGWSLNLLGLPEPSRYIPVVSTTDSSDVDIEEQISSLNEHQKAAFDSIISSVDQGSGSVFFLDGPAGTGKTYLYNVLSSYLKKINKTTIQLATTGIAADLLEDGRTVHSGMKLPVPLTESSVSRLQPFTPEAERVIGASLILIDEVSMMSKYALDAIDEVLRRLHRSNAVFGGKTILLGGDFRQTANIVLKGTPLDIIENSLLSARAWRHVSILSLTANMRAMNQGMFAGWLLSIGNGRANDCEGQVTIPDEYLEKNDLVGSIFGSKIIEVGDESIFNKIILTTRNDFANGINSRVLGLVSGPTRVYPSADTIVSDEPSEIDRYTTEFLNGLQPSGLPPHELSLKVGSIVILLRNLDARSGLLNGTRLCVKELHNNFIVGQVITGRTKGAIVSIPRIDMMPSDTTLPFVLKRRQFPVMLSFAMTIHKAQGQSFDKVGVYLPEPVFTHGQLYVALSRIRDGSNLKVFIPSENNGKTRNIVFRELIGP
nr:unnamed protein product [Papilio xuthus]